MKYCPECKGTLRPVQVNGNAHVLCDECGYVFYNNPRPCVIAVCVRDGKILFARRAIEPGVNKWDLPGGFVEHMEHPEDALVREINEELGVNVVSQSFLGIYMDHYGDAEFSTLNIAYICKLEGEPFIKDDEIGELKWFAFSGLPEDYAFSAIRKVMEDVKQMQNGSL